MLATLVVALGVVGTWIGPGWLDPDPRSARAQVGNTPPGALMGSRTEPVVHAAGWHAAIELGIGP